MIYFTTGANGTFKTALTLREVRAKSVAENRPVAYNGRFRMKADFGWKLIDAKDWEKEPDGTIFFFDECQNDFPVRTGKDAPRYITQLAEHRVRGFDFYLLSQHPLNIDAFVRRIIGAPGWHRHHKRASGAPLVSVLEWPSVNSNCDKAGSGESGTVTMKAAPTEVYDWYESATLHTAKTKIPLRVWLFIACIVAAPLLVYFAYSKFTTALSGRSAQVAKLSGQEPAVPGTTSTRVSNGKAPDRKPMTTAEYIASYQPRIAGVPQSAPRYDELTRPTQAPRPAACVHGTRRGTRESVCMCWSQQATALDVPDAVCKQIAAGGYFDDTLPPPRDNRESLATARPALVSSPSTAEPPSLAVMGASPLLAPPEVKSTVAQDDQVRQFMRKRQYIQ